MLPCLTAVTEARSYWPSSSRGALLGGCWSSPFLLPYLELCAAVGETGGTLYYISVVYRLCCKIQVSLCLYLSLQFPFFCLEFIFYFLCIICWWLVPGHLPFKSVNLENRQTFSFLCIMDLQHHLNWFTLTYILFHCANFLFCLRKLEFVFTYLSVGVSCRENRNQSTHQSKHQKHFVESCWGKPTYSASR